MSELSVLRMYMPMSARARATRLWHRLSAPQLAQHLLAQARRMGIRQALLFHVASGYLPGEKPSHFHVEGTATRQSQCIELIDTEARLRAFLTEHHTELHAIEAVLLRCELPLEISKAGVNVLPD